MTIKVSELAAKVTELGERHPERVYSEWAIEQYPDMDGYAPCRYQINDQPACIIGQALHELGVSVTRLDQYDDGYGRAIGSVLNNFAEDFEFDSDDDKAFVTQVQIKQDRRVPWGEAVSQ